MGKIEEEVNVQHYFFKNLISKRRPLYVIDTDLVMSGDIPSVGKHHWYDQQPTWWVVTYMAIYTNL